MASRRLTDQRSEHEEDHEDSTEDSLAGDVAVADRRHGDQREVDAFPVRQPVNVLVVVERIARVFHLNERTVAADSWSPRQ